MIYAVKFNDNNKVVTVNSFENESEVPADLVVYTGEIAPDKLLLKTKEELGL